MKSMAPVQILGEAIYISLHTNIYWKGMNPTVLLPYMSKLKDRLGSFALFWQPVKEKENSEFKSALLHLKIDLVSHLACHAGVE